MPEGSFCDRLMIEVIRGDSLLWVFPQLALMNNAWCFCCIPPGKIRKIPWQPVQHTDLAHRWHPAQGRDTAVLVHAVFFLSCSMRNGLDSHPWQKVSSRPDENPEASATLRSNIARFSSWWAVAGHHNIMASELVWGVFPRGRQRL